MKKILTLILLAFMSMTASAQSYLGGSLGLGYDFDSKSVNFTLSPEFGYNLNSKWAVGGTLTYSYQGEQEVNIFALQPYARYTFAKVADNKLHFFCDGTVGFGLIAAKHEDTGALWQIGFRPGMSYSLNNHWSIVAHLGFLGYNGANEEAQDIGYHNRFGFDFGSLNLSFGVYYSF